MRARVALLVPLLACSVAASKPERPATQPDIASPSVAAPELDASAPLLLGWAEPRLDYAAKARRSNREGLALHRAGDHAGARTHFEAALAADPSYAWARYNLACALSRLGELELAAGQLEPLLREDLPTFGPRLDGDEDLAPLRETASGEALLELRERVTKGWAAALDEGVIAYAYRPRERGDEGSDIVLYDRFRVGVYVPRTRRFLPLAPQVDHALTAIVDREAARVLVLSGRIISGTLFVIEPIDIGVHLFDLAEPGRVVSELDDLERTREQLLAHDRHGVWAAIEGDNVRLTYQDLQFAQGHHVSLRVSGTTSQLLSETFELAPESEYHIGNDQPHVFVDGHGASVFMPARSEAARALAKQPDVHVEQTLDGHTLMLLAQSSSCGEEGEVHEHELTRHDLQTGESQTVSKQDTRIGAALGRDGSVYVDDGAQVHRYPPGSREALADVPEGVRFVTPGFGYDCSI